MGPLFRIKVKNNPLPLYTPRYGLNKPHTRKPRRHTPPRNRHLDRTRRRLHHTTSTLVETVYTQLTLRMGYKNAEKA